MPWARARTPKIPPDTVPPRRVALDMTHTSQGPALLLWYKAVALEFLPMGAQLLLKAALPLAGILATAWYRCRKTGPLQTPASPGAVLQRARRMYIHVWMEPRGVTIHRCIGESYRNCQRYANRNRQWLNRFSRYFLWWQKSGNKVSLKSENLPNSPNKMSDKCYGMKFDLFDDQLLLKRHPTAQFNRWAKMGVVCNHVRNAALNGSNQLTPRQLFFNHVN